MATQISTVSIEPMRFIDLDTVMRLDRQCFASPWVADAYLTELGNRSAQYFVARMPQMSRVMGYGGLWTVNGEAHITTLGVDPAYRRSGIGERLLIALLSEAIIRGAKRVALEVREGNLAARRLYSKYGFHEVEKRLNYYVDNQENAIILRVDDVNMPEYARSLRQMVERLR